MSGGYDDHISRLPTPPGVGSGAGSGAGGGLEGVPASPPI